MYTGHGLFAIFTVGKEDIESLVTAVADKVVGRHESILMESPGSVERGKLLSYSNKSFNCAVIQ
jgi:hypothetical protein